MFQEALHCVLSLCLLSKQVGFNLSLSPIIHCLFFSGIGVPGFLLWLSDHIRRTAIVLVGSAQCRWPCIVSIVL